MKVKRIIVIESDVNNCSDCPYFKFEQDMNATLFVCEKIRELKGSENYIDVLTDIDYFNYYKKISKYCPLINK